MSSGSHDASVAEGFVESDVEKVDFLGLFPFVDDDEWFEVPVVSADEVTVDESRFEWWRADAGDDDECVEVCDEWFGASTAGFESFDEA